VEMKKLSARVLALLHRVPKGRVTTYKALARAIGNENLARVIGRILSQNKEVDKYPCYKVVRSDGRIGGYSLGVREKIRRLKREGIGVKNNRIIDFERMVFEFDEKLKRKN